MSGAGGKSMGAYDYLIKLMLIGKLLSPPARTCAPPLMLSALEPQFDALTLAAATLTTGDSGVGKSSLLLRFSDDSFDMNCTPTIGSLCWLPSSFLVIPVCVWRSLATYRNARGVCVTTVRPASVDRD